MNSVINPLDSSRSSLRTQYNESLIKNLDYNEKRQKDLLFFEISDIYHTNDVFIHEIICYTGKCFKLFNKMLDLNQFFC